jgi:hypothetical protein
MEAWFREYYEDPANETPRDDGEFVYPWGGPYDAFDELYSEFGGLVPGDRVQELAEKLTKECIDWAPTGRKQREENQLPEQAHTTPDFPFGLVNQVVRYQPGVYQRSAPFEANQSFFWPGVQDRPIPTPSGSPPGVLPSTGDTAANSFPPSSYCIEKYNKTTGMRAGFHPIPDDLLSEVSRITGFRPGESSAPYLLNEDLTKGVAEALGFHPEANLFYFILPFEPSDVSAVNATAEQRPAAYRFVLRDGKIDVLAEPPEPEEREFALATYHELVAKVRELHDHLRGTNTAGALFRDVARLLAALGNQFADVNVGVLLSRSRSLEADLAAFGGELFPDAIAMMDGTTRTLRDLLALFPMVRRIEAEVLALDLDRSADAVPTIRQHFAAIEAAAEKSEAVTAEAIGALTQNNAAIEDALDPVVQRSLIADKLLVFRNFASAIIKVVASYSSVAVAKVGKEAGELAGESWHAIKHQLPKGLGVAAAVAPLLFFADQITDPYLRMGAAVPAFAPVASVLKKAIADQIKNALGVSG